MRTLAVRLTIRADQAKPTELTLSAVEVLHSPRCCDTAHVALNRYGPHLRKDLLSLSLMELLHLVEHLDNAPFYWRERLLQVRQSLQVKLADLDLGTIEGRPLRDACTDSGNLKYTVVSIPFRWRVTLITLIATYNPNRVFPLITTLKGGIINVRPRLTAKELAGIGVTIPTLRRSRVLHGRPTVVIIHIATIEDDRIGNWQAILVILEPGDAPLVGLVKLGAHHLASASEVVTHNDTLNVPDHPFDFHEPILDRPRSIQSTK
ncbi:hypothetical protein OV320_4392 [Actinobacteria bacterium OV320]|nr:hypothetical protein OV320_4392 [Actinobacteria bacterium OV320]